MKKKLKLNDLKVESFVTEANAAKGGVDLTLVLPTQRCTIVIATQNCASIHKCPTIPLDQCPTTDNACPTAQVACPSNPVVGCVNTLLCLTVDIAV